MNNLSSRRLFLIFFFLTLAISSCNAQIFHKNPEKKLFGRSLGNMRQAKVKEPKSVMKAKRKQEANERKLNREYAKSVKRSQKRTVDIQTPEVKARMKQNKKDTKLRDKEKRKNIKSSTRGAGKKYN